MHSQYRVTLNETAYESILLVLAPTLIMLGFFLSYLFDIRPIGHYQWVVYFTLTIGFVYSFFSVVEKRERIRNIYAEANPNLVFNYEWSGFAVFAFIFVVVVAVAVWLLMMYITHAVIQPDLKSPVGNPNSKMLSYYAMNFIMTLMIPLVTGLIYTGLMTWTFKPERAMLTNNEIDLMVKEIRHD